MDSLGRRMKNNYERQGKNFLLRRTPVIIRVDGRAFHTYTRRFEKPFDHNLMEAFRNATDSISKEMQGFKLAYLQSDEVSFLLTDYDKLETEAWFNYEKSKLESITASLFTAYFNSELITQSDNIINKLLNSTSSARTPFATFDARAFNLPKEEVTNYFLWRAKDWVRNSIQMYARSFFSHNELHQKNTKDIHEMLHSIGKNWTNDLSNREKNGLFVMKWWIEDKENYYCADDVIPSYDSINELIKPYL